MNDSFSNHGVCLPALMFPIVSHAGEDEQQLCVRLELTPDTELLEDVCLNENERNQQDVTGK